MSFITTALFALTSLTGVATTNTVDTTVNDLANVCSLVNEPYSINLEDKLLEESVGIVTNINSIDESINVEELELDRFSSTDLLYYNDIYTLKGYNSYLEIVFNDKYVIYDKNNDVIIETGVLKLNPYLQYKDYFKVYSNEEYGFKYLVYINEEFINIETYKTPSFTSIYNDFQDDNYDAGDYIQYTMYPTGTTTAIDHDYYFRRLYGGYGYNSQGVCGIISTQVLFGYMNFFYNDNIVEEQYEYKVEAYTTVTSDFQYSPATGFYDQQAGNEYMNYLIQLCTELTGYSPIGGMNFYRLNLFINEFFEMKNLNVSYNTSEGNTADILTNRAKTMIMNAINNDRPCIANGTNHSVVAYAYCPNFVYVESGLSYNTMKTPWSTFQGSIGGEYTPSMIDIVYNDVHVCSNDYYAKTAQVYLCPCQD